MNFIITLIESIGIKTINLLSIFILILILESIMRHHGMIQKTIKGLNLLMQNSILAPSIMPLFIGMLPSPGGARLSCPVVEDVTGDNTTSTNKAYINYWYRHNWMDAFILYPPIILAANILDQAVLTLFVWLLPIMILWYLIGILVGLKNVKRTNKNKLNIPLACKLLLQGLYPIFTIILLYIGLSLYNIPFALQVSSILIITALKIINHIPNSILIQYTKASIQPKLLLIFTTVMIITGILNTSGLMQYFVYFFKLLPVPLSIMIFVVPMLAGLIAGNSVTAISLTFPLFTALGISDIPSLFILAYTGTMTGVMLSPAHLCSVVSAEYFNVTLSSLNKKVVISLLLLLPIVGLLSQTIYL